MTNAQNNYSKGNWVFWSFFAFFITIASLDAIFCYVAIRTNPGVIIENSYEKGLAYNQSLEKAKSQPQWQQKATYKKGVLRWHLSTKNNNSITAAVVKAHIIRPISNGYDFDVVLEHKGNGVYEAILNLPLQGRWIAKMSGTWNNKQYQISYEFMK